MEGKIGWISVSGKNERTSYCGVFAALGREIQVVGETLHELIAM
jgi:hypothetical protein